MADENAAKPAGEDFLRMTAQMVAAYLRKNSVTAVPIKKSITPDYIVCLEDGRKLKMLKRHLRSTYGLTPEQYRQKWGLAADYPMVAPKYAEQRSVFAKKIGLGRGAGKKKPA